MHTATFRPDDLSATGIATPSLAGGTGLALPSLDNTYGALFLGMVFGLMYFRLYPKDQPIIFWLVIVVVILETAHTLFMVAACYWHLVTNYFNPPSLEVGYWATRAITPFTGATVLVCQSFYARRVWYVGPNYRYLVGVAVCLMVCIFGFVVAATVETVRLSLAEFKQVSWLISAVYGVIVVVDILLTVSLIVVLLQSKTGFKRTDSTIGVIVLYTVNTGLLTSVVGLFCFVFAAILPGNMIYIGITLVSAKLYANSVLAVLNSRRALSDRMMHGGELGTFEPRLAPTRPHTQGEIWNIPETQIDTIHFARPKDVTTDLTDLTDLTSLRDTQTQTTQSQNDGVPFSLDDKHLGAAGPGRSQTESDASLPMV